MERREKTANGVMFTCQKGNPIIAGWRIRAIPVLLSLPFVAPVFYSCRIIVQFTAPAISVVRIPFSYLYALFFVCRNLKTWIKRERKI